MHKTWIWWTLGVVVLVAVAYFAFRPRYAMQPQGTAAGQGASLINKTLVKAATAQTA